MQLPKHLPLRLMLLALSTTTLVITYCGLLLYKHTPAQAQDVHVVCSTTGSCTEAYYDAPSLQVVVTQLTATKLPPQQQQLTKLSSAQLTLPVLVKQERVSQSSNNQQQRIQLSGAPVTVFVAFPVQPAPASLSRSHFVLNISGIQYDPSKVIPYGIYLNLPQGATPNPDSPHYVGKLALFAYPQGGTFSIDVTDAVSQLQNLNLITGDTISVTFAPRIVEEVTRQSQGNICFSRVTITRR